MGYSETRVVGRADARESPWSEEAESSVLGAMLLDEESMEVAIEQLKQEFFYRRGNRLIFDCISDIVERGDAVDVVTVADELKSRNQLDTVGGMSYLAELVEASPSFANTEDHCRLIRKKASLRRLIESANEILHRAYNAPNSEIDQVIDQAERAIYDASHDSQQKTARSAADILDDLFDEIEERINSKHAVTGIKTGFTELDRMTSGFKPGQLIIVAGRPSMGKSAVACNIAATASIAHDHKVAIFSLEMSEGELLERILVGEARVDSNQLRIGQLNFTDHERITHAAGLIKQAPIYIDDSPGITPLQLRAKARRLHRRHDLDMIIVDYLQLMNPGGDHGNREQEVSNISRSLKELSKELELPVIALSQLSRRPEHRDDKRPVLADLRESGAIEQDADIVLFVYRPSVYYGDIDSEGRDISRKAELIVGKQRNGPTGIIEGTFTGEYMLFEDL